jgi:hypothetical protein
MKTIALTLFIAGLGFAQSQSNPTQSGTASQSDAQQSKTAQAKTAQAKAPAKKVAPVAQDKKEPTAQQKALAQSQVQSIPPGATLVEPNLYRYTDSSGKTWNFRQTPFGISRWEESSVPSAQAAPQSAPAKAEGVVVTDLGDSYRFQKKTPFGGSSWTRKKSELTDEERALVDVQQAPPDATQNRVDSKPAGN